MTDEKKKGKWRCDTGCVSLMFNIPGMNLVSVRTVLQREDAWQDGVPSSRESRLPSRVVSGRCVGATSLEVAGNEAVASG